MTEDAGQDGKTTRDANPAARRIRLLALLPLVVLALFAFLHDGFGSYLSRGLEQLLAGDGEALRTWAQKAGPGPWLATSLLMILQALLFPIPAVLVTATNALLYGWVLGGILSIAQATLAAWLCFAIARLGGDTLVSAFVSKDALARCDRFLDRHGAETVLLARLLPFVPFDVASFAAGLARMKSWPFLWATFLGQIPAGMAYAWVAVQISERSRAWVLVPAVLASLLVIGFIARRALRRERARSGSGHDLG